MTRDFNSKMLLQLAKTMLLVVITLFSVVIFNVNAENGHVKYSYSEFDWDTFYQERKLWWGDTCLKDNGEIPDWCDDVFKSEKEFYTRFYKLLAKMDKEGLSIIDEVLLQVIFYGMMPEGMTDDGQYQIKMQGGVKPYNMDESEEAADPKLDVIVEAGPSVWDQIVGFLGGIFKSKNNGGYEGNFYSMETDSLKTLIQNMISYKTVCYGEVGKPTLKEDANHNKYYDCSAFEGTHYKHIPFSLTDAGRVSELHGTSGDWCVIENNYSLGYYKYFSSKWEHLWYPFGDIDGAADWYGEVPVDDGFIQCQELDSALDYGAIYEYLEEDESHSVDTEVFFDFLRDTRYFDRKAHLQSYYRFVLNKAGVDCMTNDVCENSLEAKGFDAYQEHIDLIKSSRLSIISSIIQNLKFLGYDIDYEGLNNGAVLPAEEMNETVRKSNYWPIGSDETEVRNGVLFADGEPASVNVIKPFGEDSTGNMHYGIDISGVDGVTNVISVGDGDVISIYTGCTTGDKTCNEGYGNQIIISATNGDYIVYGHMSDITVSVGDHVLRGQVIGHVGQTGDCDSPCLHWEIRVGANDQAHAINPEYSISSSNPRPSLPASIFPMHSTSLTREEFISKLVAYCNSHSCNSNFITYFVNQAGLVYDLSIKYNLNPEFVIVKAMGEGFSPGGTTYNFWGIGCVNSDPNNTCLHYSSFENGIKGLANLKIVKNATTAEDVMRSGYSYIGDYWWQIYSKSGSKNWSPGGCVWLPYVEKYLSSSRASTVKSYCAINNCPYEDKGSVGKCLKTTSEDQDAYVSYLVQENMASKRYNVFGI